MDATLQLMQGTSKVLDINKQAGMHRIIVGNNYVEPIPTFAMLALSSDGEVSDATGGLSFILDSSIYIYHKYCSH